MRAACCEATVLRNEVIAPDIRLLMQQLLKICMWMHWKRGQPQGNRQMFLNMRLITLQIQQVCLLVSFMMRQMLS